MIHAAIELCQNGDVLVVAPTSESTDGMFGELLATSCRAHGIAGLIIDAGVRDVSEISAMRFPVWAKTISAQGTVKASPGSINVEIVCAGAVVRPGDVVVGDEDGVVIVPRERAADVCQSAAERISKEEATRARLRAGELGLDFYGLRAKLRELGVQYLDEEERDG
jgi:4-hydroxy-4-methyl-2-oxoglutarate aldolase